MVETQPVQDVNWLQHPVGHGGFHTGRLQFFRGPKLNWIFDCGSRRTKKFDEYLRSWITLGNEEVDWLFISHFDTDHVSGLEVLMANAVVKNVMVPYVNERELLGQLLQIIDGGDTSRYIFDLAADPGGYFLSRGAQRVIFVGGGGDDRILIETGDPSSPDGSGDGMKECRILIRPAPRSLNSGQIVGAAPNAKVELSEQGCEIEIHSLGRQFLFKPFRAPLDQSDDDSLLVAIQNLVGDASLQNGRPGLGDLAYAVARFSRTAAGRAKLRQVYKLHVGSSNRSSLSLLSMPLPKDAAQSYFEVESPSKTSMSWSVPAWLNTGDAELKATQDLQSWRAHYSAELGHVRVLALPHHGSDHNSDQALHDLCPRAILAAHVKSDATKHPGVDTMLTAGERLVRVTEQAGHYIRMHFQQREDI
ncbi:MULTISPECIES: MBL fold metallo-hydrolase [unclassified Sphingopyxis]|uniref:MBL fold metallo-hydrolase n=1 Tax=unclassified Sphingopyxis TaxID=2614943 RepID=UPI00286545A5|nr:MULTISPECIES: MBL fold metallo-hydrolase [unclassified Sphingopyxis]MDR7062477.1 hypothetical protein [Sphingopyxis sp. BE235]MDR7182942.1 hypothetical protein [Sphingopyxis sp. BE249]